MASLKLLKNIDTLGFPRLEDVSPQYVELRGKADAIGREIDHLRQRQRALADAGETRNDAKGEGGINAAAEARVAKILGRQPVERAPKRDIEKDLQTIDRDVKDREAALVVIDREIELERRAASSVIMQQLEPQYRELISTICKALLGLHDANRRYNDLADHINNNGISWSGIEGMPPWFLGHPNNPDGNLARYLREAVASGFLKASEFPEEFR